MADAINAQFARLNAAFWTSLEKKPPAKIQGCVLSVIAGNPVVKLSDASFSAIVGRAESLRPLFLVGNIQDEDWTTVLRSYPDATLVPLPQRWGFWKNVAAGLRAIWACLRFKSPPALRKFRQDGIMFGDVVYDEILKGGYATVSHVDFRAWKVLRRFYLWRQFILSILDQYEVKSSVFGHCIGLTMATLSRYLVSRDIEVLWRLGSHQILVRRYRSLRDVGIYPATPKRHTFERMVQTDDGTIQRKAEEYLERRFQQEVDDPTVFMAFDGRKKTYATAKEFCREYGLNPRRPLVFVMLHAFNDYPHSHFAKPMLFQDYYHWFRETLSIAQVDTRTNWIFKEHPAALKYPTKDVSLARTFRAVRENNILLLPHNANFNARSIGYVAHAIVTCVGTAGLEYATLGIPCILAGQSGYDGFGFTQEPSTPQEYRTLLFQIRGVPRLSTEQIARAKLVAYFYFCVMESARYHFCPTFTEQEIREWKPEFTERMWREASQLFLDRESTEKMQEQVGLLSSFVLDKSREVYIDPKQFSFLFGGKEHP